MSNETLAKLMIYLAALIAWAVTGRDEQMFEKVQELGKVKLEDLTWKEQNAE